MVKRNRAHPALESTSSNTPGRRCLDAVIVADGELGSTEVVVPADAMKRSRSGMRLTRHSDAGQPRPGTFGRQNFRGRINQVRKHPPGILFTDCRPGRYYPPVWAHSACCLAGHLINLGLYFRPGKLVRSIDLLGGDDMQKALPRHWIVRRWASRLRDRESWLNQRLAGWFDLVRDVLPVPAAEDTDWLFSAEQDRDGVTRLPERSAAARAAFLVDGPKCAEDDERVRTRRIAAGFKPW